MITMNSIALLPNASVDPPCCRRQNTGTMQRHHHHDEISPYVSSTTTRLSFCSADPAFLQFQEVSKKEYYEQRRRKTLRGKEEEIVERALLLERLHQNIALLLRGREFFNSGGHQNHQSTTSYYVAWQKSRPQGGKVIQRRKFRTFSPNTRSVQPPRSASGAAASPLVEEDPLLLQNQ
jgi:hypothetical protein